MLTEERTGQYGGWKLVFGRAHRTSKGQRALLHHPQGGEGPYLVHYCLSLSYEKYSSPAFNSYVTRHSEVIKAVRINDEIKHNRNFNRILIAF